MKPRIVFLIMSAVHPPETVAEQARVLAPHTVLLHHDFAQAPDFEVREPNIVLVPDPRRTGWGVWGFTEGVFHSFQYALEHLEFDYLQLLSPACLPIKPLGALEEHVASNRTDADFSCVDLLDERDGLMTASYRAFAPEHSLRHRMLRRLSRTYYGASSARRDVAGVQLRTDPLRETRLAKLRASIALNITRAWAHPVVGRHIFDDNLRPCFGSAWFGARRPVIEWMVERFAKPDIQRYFPRVRLPEELVMPTLLRNSPFRSGPYNHCIVTFRDANPKWLGDEDFEILKRSPAFFARKFPVDTATPFRQRVLRELVGRRPEAASAPPAADSRGSAGPA
jgi:hypothetical protein